MERSVGQQKREPTRNDLQTSPGQLVPEWMLRISPERGLRFSSAAKNIERSKWVYDNPIQAFVAFLGPFVLCTTVLVLVFMALLNWFNKHSPAEICQRAMTNTDLGLSGDNILYSLWYLIFAPATVYAMKSATALLWVLSQWWVGLLLIVAVTFYACALAVGMKCIDGFNYHRIIGMEQTEKEKIMEADERRWTGEMNVHVPGPVAHFGTEICVDRTPDYERQLTWQETWAFMGTLAAVYIACIAFVFTYK